MATAIQRRRGNTAQHASFTGLSGEITIDTDKNTVVVHDGVTAGGYPLARADEVAALGGADITAVIAGSGLTGGASSGNATISLNYENLAGNLVPSANNTYSLGKANKVWKDVFVGPGSLYVNGQKVLADNSGTITVSADAGQNLALVTSASGDIELNAGATGDIQIKSNVILSAGKTITASGGLKLSSNLDVNSQYINNVTNPVQAQDAATKSYVDGATYLSAGDGISKSTGQFSVDNTVVRTSGTQTIGGAKTFSSDLVVSGNLTVSGTTTTVNSETISLADNIIDLNSNFTTGSPTENAGIRIKRGDSADVQVRWNEADDKWQFTNDGSAYLDMLTPTQVKALFSATDAGGDGSFSYSDGVFTYTGPSQSEANTRIDARLSGTNGVSYSSGVISLASSTGGAGLTYTSGVLAVGAGDGVTVNADNVAINVAYVRSQFSASGDISYNASTGVFSFTNDAGDIESVTAGSGLTGGGVSGAVTLNIGAGTGIIVNADDVAVNATYVKSLFSATDAGGDGSFSYSDGVFTYTGPSQSEANTRIDARLSGTNGVSYSSGVISIASSAAGAGLTYTSGVLAVGAGTGITVNADDIALSTSGVTAGTYGSATQASQVVVDTYGRVTSASNVTVTPAVGSITGLGTGVATALAVNVGSAGAPVVNGGALGTPSSGTLTNATGLPISSGVSGLGTGVATFLATPSSANLASAVTDETGSGALVFANSPTLVTPTLGAASATSVTTTGDVTVGGNLTVSGTTFTVNAETINLADNFISLNSNLASNVAPTENAGIEINRGSSTAVQVRWNETSDIWQFTNNGTNYFPLATSTTDLAEGTNLYYTVARANSAIDARVQGGAGLTYTSGVLAVGAGAGITVNADDVALSTSGVTAGTYGSATAVGQVVVDTYGRVTSAGNVTVTPAVGSITGLASGMASFLAAGNASTFAGAVSGTTGSGNIVLATNPVLVTPNLGTPSALILTNATGLKIEGIAAGNILTSAETFVDTDNQLMTAAAIDDRILSYGYTTNVGDITGVTAGNGLTGGGLSGDVTLNIGGGYGISVNADNIELANTDVRGLFSGTTGISYNSGTGAFSLDTSTGGAGLTYSSGVLAVGAGAGITVNADNVALSTSGVTSGTYGSASAVGQVVVDTYGRVTSASNVTISVTSGQVSDFSTAVRGNISVTDAGGDGSLGYNSTTGVITYTGPSQAEANSRIDARLSAGTGISYSSGVISLSHLGIQSLTDPNADRILFWDDSAGVSTWLEVSTGLSITGTVLTNSGVTSITGTANQVTASASTGGVTLSLPQNIHTGASPTFASATLNSITKAGTTATGNIGQSDNTFNTIFAATFSGTATQARYADLAERYEADDVLEPGTVVCFGGSKEITACDHPNDHAVVGVISTDPAYMMNSDAGTDATHPYVALTGRVPVKVTGEVNKGDLLVASDVKGHAMANNNAKAGTIIGKALGSSAGGEAVIEVLIHLM